jgi:hypothetical protein
VSNPVIVPKRNTDVQRVCVDYTSLNKHCPKDSFPLPCIDQIIDSTAGCARLSFLDAYSGYNQIKLKKEDKEKTAFITPYDICCYQVMPFGLKKCRINLSTNDAKLPWKSNRPQYPSLHQRRGHHHKKGGVFNQRLIGNLQQPQQVQAQA